MSLAAQQDLAIAIQKLEKLERDQVFDPMRPRSRPTPIQQEVLQDAATISQRYVIAANQGGKSQLGGRETSWVFQRNHPYWDVTAQYGDHPILLIVLGRVGSQVESELWERKIKPFLEPGCFKEVKQGNALQKVVHLKTGDTIIFGSHHNVNEAREKAQSFTAAYVWLDEMPGSISLITELQLRIQANNGRLLVTFTPLLKNKQIKDMVESLMLPVGKRYRFAMLDNPIYANRKEEILQSFQKLSADERGARLEGEWFKGGREVYPFDPDKDIRDPIGYHASWSHLEIVDPAASGKAGFLLLANKPNTREWYAVRAEYIQGAAATDLLDQLEQKTAGINIIRRVSDPHEAWFIKEAAKRKRYYMGVIKKNDRKNELIKNLQEAITNRVIIVTNWVGALVDELLSCMWADDSDDKIVGATRFHLLDCAQYGNDNLPKLAETPQPTSFDAALKEANRQRQANAARTAAGKHRPLGRIVAKRGQRWRV